MKVLIIQRVLTSYRFELLQEMAPFVNKLGFATSQGDDMGTLKLYRPKTLKYSNIKIHELKSMRIKYSGDSRQTSLFFYPSVLKLINSYDVILLEGTTNLLNNLLILPYAKFLKKKIIWWDAGYSLDYRTLKRKIIDIITKQFVRFTHLQFAYSTKAKKYMEIYMGAHNCYLLLNTINTEYFESIQNQIKDNIKNKQFDAKNIKFLYVGAIEERKRVKELIDTVHEMNKKSPVYSLIIIGSGNYLEYLKNYVADNKMINIIFTGPVYDKDTLKNYYFNSDLFILPGDGGLGILQSLLFGLPTVCLAADGTEEDYIDHKYILQNLHELKSINISQCHNTFDYLALFKKVDSKHYISQMRDLIL